MHPDIEAVFTFIHKSQNGESRTIYSGYRPQHKIKENYQTSGIHEYLFVDQLETGESATVNIKFCSPEFYPHCIEENQIIGVFEGAHKVGDVFVTRIFNPILAIRKNKNQKRFLLKVENSMPVGKYIAIFPGFEPNSEPIHPGQRISIIEPGGECRSANIAGLSLLNAINGMEQVQIMLSKESIISSITPKSEIWMITE